MPNNDFDNDFLDNDSDVVTVKDHPPASDSPDFAASSKKGYKSDVEPKVYMDLLRKPNRPDKHIKNFDFTLEDFENLCSVWTPKKISPSYCTAPLPTSISFVISPII